MAKKVDPLKAKAAKQKKIAIGLSVLFALVLAYQVPKTMKMLKGPQPVKAAAPLTPDASTTESGAVPPGTPGVAAPAAGAPAPAEAQPAVLANTDLALAPAAGQLLSFEQFAAKDPFQQQLVGDAPVPASAAAGDTSAGGSAAEDDKGQPGEKAGSSPDDSVIPGSGSAGAGSSPASPDAADAPPAAAASTTVSVNGAVSIVADTTTPFPASDPAFLLVSTGSDGKSVKIGIAGGAYAGGQEAITLEIGKPLTLQNTADGSRYTIELLTVQGFVTPKPKK